LKKYNNKTKNMKKTIPFSILLSGLMLTMFFSCKKSTTPTPVVDPCLNTTITITNSVTTSVPCESTPTGSITITASGSTGFTYNKNGGTYQSSNTFTGLAAGQYTMGVKDVNGCTSTQVVSVGNATQGPNFTNVKNIISANCANCHLNGGNNGNLNLDADCSIVAKWDKINLRCVVQGNMPSQGLTTNEKAQITAWVNAGHKFSD